MKRQSKKIAQTVLQNFPAIAIGIALILGYFLIIGLVRAIFCGGTVAEGVFYYFGAQSCLSLVVALSSSDKKRPTFWRIGWFLGSAGNASIMGLSIFFGSFFLIAAGIFYLSSIAFLIAAHISNEQATHFLAILKRSIRR